MLKNKFKLLFYLISFTSISLIVSSTVLAVANATNQHIPSGASACKVQWATGTHYLDESKLEYNSSESSRGLL